MIRSGFKKKVRKSYHLEELNVTPLVDVMLVLLVIFMIAAPMMTVGIPLDLPEGKKSSAVSTNKKTLTISINKDGNLFIMDEQIQYDLLYDKLTILSPEIKQDTVYLRADKNLTYELVAKTLAILSSAGFAKISLIMDGK